MGTHLPKPTTVHVVLASQKPEPTKKEREFFDYLERLIRAEFDQVFNPEVRLAVHRVCQDSDIAKYESDPVNNPDDAFETRIVTDSKGEKQEKKKTVLALGRRLTEAVEGSVEADALADKVQLRTGVRKEQTDRFLNDLFTPLDNTTKHAVLLVSPEDTRLTESKDQEEKLISESRLELSSRTEYMHGRKRKAGANFHQVYVTDSTKAVDFKLRDRLDLAEKWALDLRENGAVPLGLFNRIPRIIQKPTAYMQQFVHNMLSKIAYDFRHHGSRFDISRKQLRTQYAEQQEFEAVSSNFNSPPPRKTAPPVIEPEPVQEEALGPQIVSAMATDELFSTVDTAKLDPLSAYNLILAEKLGLPSLSEFVPRAADWSNLHKLMGSTDAASLNPYERARVAVMMLALNKDSEPGQALREAESFNYVLVKLVDNIAGASTQALSDNLTEDVELNRDGLTDLAIALAKEIVSPEIAHQIIRVANQNRIARLPAKPDEQLVSRLRDDGIDSLAQLNAYRKEGQELKEQDSQSKSLLLYLALLRIAKMLKINNGNDLPRWLGSKASDSRTNLAHLLDHLLEAEPIPEQVNATFTEASDPAELFTRVKEAPPVVKQVPKTRSGPPRSLDEIIPQVKRRPGTDLGAALEEHNRGLREFAERANAGNQRPRAKPLPPGIQVPREPASRNPQAAPSSSSPAPVASPKAAAKPSLSPANNSPEAITNFGLSEEESTAIAPLLKKAQGGVRTRERVRLMLEACQELNKVGLPVYYSTLFFIRYAIDGGCYDKPDLNKFVKQYESDFEFSKKYSEEVEASYQENFEKYIELAEQARADADDQGKAFTDKDMGLIYACVCGKAPQLQAIRERHAAKNSIELDAKSTDLSSILDDEYLAELLGIEIARAPAVSPATASVVEPVAATAEPDSTPVPATELGLNAAELEAIAPVLARTENVPTSDLVVEACQELNKADLTVNPLTLFFIRRAVDGCFWNYASMVSFLDLHGNQFDWTKEYADEGRELRSAKREHYQQLSLQARADADEQGKSFTAEDMGLIYACVCGKAPSTSAIKASHAKTAKIELDRKGTDKETILSDDYLSKLLGVEVTELPIKSQYKPKLRELVKDEEASADLRAGTADNPIAQVMAWLKQVEEGDQVGSAFIAGVAYRALATLTGSIEVRAEHASIEPVAIEIESSQALHQAEPAAARPEPEITVVDDEEEVEASPDDDPSLEETDAEESSPGIFDLSQLPKLVGERLGLSIDPADLDGDDSGVQTIWYWNIKQGIDLDDIPNSWRSQEAKLIIAANFAKANTAYGIGKDLLDPTAVRVFIENLVRL
ncbi:MAG: hypothetical protein OXU45_02345 [Candidatus Melainabacteria bacterium]|nr:hypothetical protein [Candidatus Melainabacteria bacterium]